MNHVVRKATWIGLCALVAVLVLTLGPVVQGQVVKGSISGNIIDVQGALVPDAEIKAVNTGTGETANTVTDKNGGFRLNLLSVGTYRLEVTKQGFRKMVVGSVTVNAGQDTGMGSLQLEVGDVATTVEVIATAPLVDNTEAQITSNFTSSTLQSMPSIQANQGLDFLALYVPGVSSTRDSGFSNTNGTGFAVEGLRGRTNDQQIDGQYNNDNSVGGPGVFLSDTQFVQEYEVTTNNMSAEYGRNSGSVVNILTKSGTNTVHGSVYGTEGNAGLDALSHEQKVFQGLYQVPHYNDAFAGATVGGPLWKDHLFYFGGFDTEIIGQTSVYSSGSLTPTPAGIGQLEACFPYTDPVTGLPGVAPAMQVLANYGPFAVGGGDPTPIGLTTKTYTGSNGLPCSVEESGISRTLPTGSHQYNWVYKMDLVTEKNRFYGRYLYNNATFYNTDTFGGGGAAAGYPASVPGLGQQYGFSWVRTISNRMTNEFRASFGRQNFGFGGNSIGNTVPTATNLTDALTRVSTGSGNLGFGPATNAPQGRIVNSYQFQDNWAYVLSRHALKAGFNYTYQRSPNYFLPNVNGSFSYSSYPNMARNIASSISVTAGNPVLDFREHDSFFYVQDDFKLKSNLTLNLGLTYSYYGQPANLFHDQTTEQQSSSQPFWDPTLPTSVTTFPSIPAPKTSFGPNVGFAWTPESDNRFLGRNKTTIRGGYRYAYDPPFYNIYLNIASAAPNALAQTLTSASIGGPLPSIPTDPFGPTVRDALGSYLTFGVSDPRTFNQTNLTNDFGPDKTSRWSLGVQREITKSAVVEVRYVGNHATNLFQSINQNPYIAGLAADFPGVLPSGVSPCASPVIPSASGRVSCDEGRVRQRTNTAYSDYNGVEVQLRTNNLWNQLTMQAGYTFSKTTDNADEIFGTFAGGGTIAFSQNPLGFTGEEHGLSGLDFPHQFTMLVTEAIPVFRKQQGVVGHLLGGWQIAGAYRLSSGQTYTPTQYALSYFSGSPYVDVTFNTGFAGNYDGGTRPFIGSLSAPATEVGIFAADACNNFGVSSPAGGLIGAGCTLAASQLISLNKINQGDTDGTPVDKNAVRFIANGYEADQIFGTPYGNAGRNTLRDWKVNNLNLSLIKNFKCWERANIQLHLDASNVLNHIQFTSIDPFIDDAGNSGYYNGFANPALTDSPSRTIRVGLIVTF